MSHDRPAFSSSKAILVLVLSVGLGIVVGRPAHESGPSTVVRGEQEMAYPSAGTASDQRVETIIVHVSGAVSRPGLVELAPGSRVADALEAAGGAVIGADLIAVNLAQSVVDGQQIVVPEAGQATPVSHSGGDGVAVNSADAGALEALPGVGPVLAASIVAYRDEHGPYEAVEDLLSVPGIGESKLASLRDRVVVP